MKVCTTCNIAYEMGRCPCCELESIIDEDSKDYIRLERKYAVLVDRYDALTNKYNDRVRLQRDAA